MAENPYSSVTISGYNASPPPDDGTQSAANQLAWEKHIEKIGDPIKTGVEGIDSATNAAFAALTMTTDPGIEAVVVCMEVYS